MATKTSTVIYKLSGETIIKKIINIANVKDLLKQIERNDAMELVSVEYAEWYAKQLEGSVKIINERAGS